MSSVYVIVNVIVKTFESCSLNSSNFCCRGVFSDSVSAIWSRIFPISVLLPVPTTTPIAFPADMLVPFKNLMRKNEKSKYAFKTRKKIF